MRTIRLVYRGERLFDSGQRGQPLGRVPNYKFRTSNEAALVSTQMGKSGPDRTPGCGRRRFSRR